MVLSGESGESTIQENLTAIAESKKISPSSLRRLHVGFKLPKLDDSGQVDDLIHDLKELQTDVVIIDPLYRSLRAGDGASNLYAMGEQLELISEKIHRAGITPVLLHHFRKQGRTFHEPPELEDLSQSGIAEFARQFILLKRCEPYEKDGAHRLYFHFGGSAGHQGAQILSVDTGSRKSGIRWNAQLMTEKDWKDGKLMKRAELRSREVEALTIPLVEFVIANPLCSATAIEEALGGSRERVRDARRIAIADGRIEAVTVGAGKRKVFRAGSAIDPDLEEEID